MSTDRQTPRHRRLVLLTGDAAQTGRWLAEALSGIDASEVLWVADQAPQSFHATPCAQVGQRLGSECRMLVFNAFDGLDPDALAAACGTLRGGGDCIVQCPPLEDWPAFADPYCARFATYPLQAEDMRGDFIRRLASLWLWHAHPVHWHGVEDVDPQLAPSDSGSALQLTAAQMDVVDRIVRVARGHARRPLVLTADRGRGKSTVLGVAAARLLVGGLRRITVVGAHVNAVATLLRHASEQTGITRLASGDLLSGDARLCFRRPSQCLSDDAEDLGLIMVDEAASLSVGVLSELLGRSNRLVFATTEHGYEGSGRGFALRFERLLRQSMPRFQRARLEEPIRWSVDDPLEALINQSLLLDANLDTPPAPQMPLSVDRIERAHLLKDEPLLRTVFGLLVTAHYQTRPSDLRRLLDDPRLELWVARVDAQLYGAVLAEIEGGFDRVMSRAIVSGQRRPRGHLLAQSLAVHAGLDEALHQRVLRIVRIAVHPALQRRGVGTHLLKTVSEWAQRQGIDAVGCAYGVEESLLTFWSGLGFVPARLGIRIDPASAAHTLFMLHGLSQPGRRLADHAERHFHADLPWSLGAVLNDLSPALAVRLLQGRRCSDLALREEEWAIVQRLANRARDPATAVAVLWRWIVCETARAPGAELEPLVAWRLQNWSRERVCRHFAIQGKAGLQAHLRDTLSRRLAPADEHG